MRYLLSKGEVLTFIVTGEIESVRVQTGRIWLTRQGDSRDYCMEAGAVFPCATTGRVVVEALEEASIAVLMVWKDAPAAAIITPGWPSLGQSRGVH